MFISDTELSDRQYLKHVAVSIGCAVFCAVFGAIYEHFSFGVWNGFMIYAFAAPLLSGALQLLALLLARRPRAGTLFLLHAASAAITVGCIVTGIVRISGRTNGLLAVYAVLGGILSVLTLLSYRKDRKTVRPE